MFSVGAVLMTRSEPAPPEPPPPPPPPPPGPPGPLDPPPLPFSTQLERLEHPALARADLITQYRHRPLIEGIVDIHASGVQGVEDALHQVLTCDALETATGAQLTEIAALVGQVRGSLSDEQLRAFVAARILVNRSSGEGDLLLAMLERVLSVQGAPGFTLREDFPACIVTIIDGAVSDPPSVAAMLRAARAGGVRSILEWSTVPAEETFAFAAPDVPGDGFGVADDETTGGGLAAAME